MLKLHKAVITSKLHCYLVNSEHVSGIYMYVCMYRDRSLAKPNRPCTIYIVGQK